jgi:hypothetical protein
MNWPAALGLLALLGTESRAGPYSAARNDPDHPHDAPIPGYVGEDGPGWVTPTNRLNPQFVAWASQVVDYSPAGGVDAAWSDPAQALGPPVGDAFAIVSLGELSTADFAAQRPPGSLTLAFPVPITDGPGPDFAVFENGFDGFFELATVEVSTDGQTFVRFPPLSLTPGPLGGYAALDPTDVFHLAGKHVNHDGECWGTPFDLARLPAHPAVNPRLIRFVRLVDLPGRGDFLDASDPPRPIYDPWPTFGSGGFDLDAVGVLHPALQLVGTADEAGGLVLTWSSVTPRWHRLLRQGGSTLPWLPVWEGQGTGGEARWLDSAPTSGARYRLELLPWP